MLNTFVIFASHVSNSDMEEMFGPAPSLSLTQIIGFLILAWFFYSMGKSMK